MSTKELDPNSSSQRWKDGSRAYCDDWDDSAMQNSQVIPDSQAPNNSDEEWNESDDESKPEPSQKDESKPEPSQKDEPCDSDSESTSVGVIKRPNSLPVSVAEKVLDSIDRTHVVRGTHVHVRNNKIHLCSMSPFVFLHKENSIQDREIVVNSYFEDMETQTFDRIFDLFQRDGQLMQSPLRRKFKKKNAMLLFNISTYSTFCYDCLTLDDCEKLRQFYMIHFNIGLCKCKAKNCLDFSAFNCSTGNQILKPVYNSNKNIYIPLNIFYLTVVKNMKYNRNCFKLLFIYSIFQNRLLQFFFCLVWAQILHRLMFFWSVHLYHR